jgi:hypothetical protein
VFDEHLALFHSVLLHCVAGQRLQNQHASILTPGMKGSSDSADTAGGL